ncbi:hypothetical protein EPO04_04060 [Patescibacteria group bacterium]|nr:MAG: hypothetical protein EPO04_04060 [Patescibacteria group bacterium]
MQFSIRWRLLALLGVIFYLLTFFALFYLVLFNIVFMSLFIATTLVLSYAGWLMFTGHGGRFRGGLGLAGISAILLIVELVAFAREPGNTRVLAITVIMGLFYSGLFAALRRQYWQERRLQGESQRQSPFKKPVLIINPKSGDGRAVKAGLAAAAEKQGIKVVTTTPGSKIEQLAQAAVDDGADVLGISGGDGSIGAIAQIAISNNLPLVVLPGGTRCHFARDIGLDPNRLVDALAGFYGVERRIDVAKINNRIFLNNASFGIYADMVDQPQYRAHKIQAARNVLQDLLTGKKPAYDLKFTMGKKRYSQAVVVLIGVNRYNTMSLFELGHRQQLDGGVLQINVVPTIDDAMVRQLLRNIGLKQLSNNGANSSLQQVELSSFKINSSNYSIVVGVDGERETYNAPITVTCLPKALRLYVPAEGDRPRPGSIFKLTMLQQMWGAITGRLR